MKRAVQGGVVLVVMLLTSIPLSATSVSNTGLITSVTSYTNYGDGDVVFRVQNMPSQCYGFWLRPTDPGFKATLTLVMATYLASKRVTVTALDDVLWPGNSSQHYCLTSRVLGKP